MSHSKAALAIQPKTLAQKVSHCLIKDRFKLNQAAKKFVGLTDKELDNHADWAAWQQKLVSSQDKVKKRQAKVPKIHFDSQLPVAAKKDALIELIKENQVVVIAGETGSGKTTQIPKICLQAGLGVHGKIGCTQPRRLAARSVSERLAEELQTQVGDLVGYQVRFMDRVHQDSLIKVMTDGILLAEVQNDRFLNQYEAIIIDEAHERSINIDFLLGILKQLCLKRPDLKVIITSATIDTDRFAEHFTFNGVKPPVVEVSGRTYPVELRYRPLSVYEDDAGNQIEQDMVTGIIDAVDELATVDPFGDVLVFQVGERDIKDTAEALRKHHLKNTEIVALYARLAMSEQQKVFQTSAKRRIILSTNVAETSLTVPGIKFVIDPGKVRISRYSVRNKVQRLPVEKISQASANQRKGRCGRVSDGVCIRLYDEEDFKARPEFTDAEIHRTALTSVILSMAQLKLGSVKQFPFIEPPEEKAINDGYRQLLELGALDEKRRLTTQGRAIARLPLDPAVAKMVVEAEKNNVVAEVLIIAAALSIQDPRDINEATRQAAQQKQQWLVDERSDFLFFLNLWRFFEQQKRHLSQNKLRKLCKTNFLSYIRMREWHDLTVQLEHSLKSIGIKVGQLHLYEEVQPKTKPKQNASSAPPEIVQERLSEVHSIAVHRSLLAGLLGNIATRDEDNSYLGARNTKVFIHPSSCLFNKKPKWLLSAERVETSKLFARTNAAIDVRWVESLAGHLIKHRYSDPHWQKKSGQVGAYESITLYGLPIVSRRHCNYGPIDPVESRKIFIRQALVAGQLNSQAKFFQHNQALVTKIEKLESKCRRPDFLVEDDVVYEFYAQHLPAHIYNQPALESWLKKTNKTHPHKVEALFLDEATLMKKAVDDNLAVDYPDQIQLRNQIQLHVDYEFKPGNKRDGLIYHLPLHDLNRVDDEDFAWLTPGLLKEKTTFYIKALPKSLRKQFIPAPHYANLVLEEMSPVKKQTGGHPNPYLHQLVWALNRHAQQPVTLQEFANIKLPDHLTPFFVLEDEKGKTLAESQQLEQLKENYQHLVKAKIAQHQQAAATPTQTVIEWDFGDLAPAKKIQAQGRELLAYPALQVNNNTVELTLLEDEQLAHQAHGKAVLKLIAQLLSSKQKYLQKKLPLKKACLCYAPYGSCQTLTQNVIQRALVNLVPKPASIRSQESFNATLEQVKENWIDEAQKVAEQVSAILTKHQQVAKQVKGKVNPRLLASIADIQEQLDQLISSDFVLKTPEKWLQRIEIYLQGLELRLQKIDQNPSKDQTAIRAIQPLLAKYQGYAKDPAYAQRAELIVIRWLLEELRISIFSQPLKTLQPVSTQRIEKAFKRL